MFTAVWVLSSCVILDSQEGFLALPPCGATGSVANGWPCSCDEECASGTCWEERFTGTPLGACFQECKLDDDCALSEVCAFGRCMPRCRSFEECQPSRSCLTLLSDDDEEGFCDPVCQRDDDCQSRNCNLWSGTCMALGEQPQGLGVGEVCQQHDECKSQACIDGACFSGCVVAAEACPDDSTCVPTTLEGGICLHACQRDGQCADLGMPVCDDHWLDDDPEQGFCWYP
ncbi:MAG: hypothetical protein KTR31_17725 [Myxococcales bacterium]|nr:hypothetical protein [Myxococcales bacterium]